MNNRSWFDLHLDLDDRDERVYSREGVVSSFVSYRVGWLVGWLFAYRFRGRKEDDDVAQALSFCEGFTSPPRPAPPRSAPSRPRTASVTLSVTTSLCSAIALLLNLRRSVARLF